MRIVRTSSQAQPTSVDGPVLLTAAETAALLKVSLSTVYGWASNGSIPVWRASNDAKTIRVPLAELTRMLASQISGGNAGATK